MLTSDQTPVSETSDTGSDGGWSIGTAYTVFLLTMAYAFNFFDRLLISTLLPLIQQDLEVSDTQLGIVTGFAFVLVYAIMGIPIARLADRYSRKLILGIGFTFWSAMTFVTGYVNNFWQLAATRFLMGAGESAGTPPSTSLLSDLMNDKTRPLAFSIMVSGTAISSLVLTPAAGWIGQLYGWRVAYFIAGAVGIFFGILILLTAKEPKRGQFEKKSSISEGTKPAFKISMSFLLGQRTFVYATMGAALVTISYYAHIVWSSTFMLRVHGLNVAESASLLGPVRGLAGLTGAIAGGALLTRLCKIDERWSVWLPAACATLVGITQFLFLFGAEHHRCHDRCRVGQLLHDHDGAADVAAVHPSDAAIDPHTGNGALCSRHRLDRPDRRATRRWRAERLSQR